MTKYLSLLTDCINCEKSIKVVPGDYIAATDENSGVTQFYCITCATKEFGTNMVQLVLDNKGLTYQYNFDNVKKSNYEAESEVDE